MLEILLVEDSPTDQKLFTLAIKELPATMHCIADGEQIYHYLQNHHPHLIVLDLNIPGKDGFDVMLELKSHPDLKSTPIVVFSTSANMKDIKRCYQLGANAFMTKPLDLDRYLDAVKKTVEYWGSICVLTNRV